MALDMSTALTIRANVTGLQSVNGLTGGLAKLEGNTKKTATAMQRLKTAAAGAINGLKGLGIAAGIGLAAVSKLAFDNLQLADSMSKMSQRTGIAVPQLDRFRQAANLSDTSIESMGKGFSILAKNMKDAVEKGTGPANDAFNQLGISLTDSSGKLRDTDQVILDVADKFSKMENGTEKAALASQLFGQRLGSEMIPLLNTGRAEIEKFGTTMTQEGADRAAAFNDRIATLGERFSQLAMAATMQLLPAFEAFLGKIEEAANWFSQLPGPVQQLATGFAAIAIPLVAIAVPLGAVAGALAGLAPLAAGVGAAFAAIGPIISGLIPILAGIFTGPVGWIALLTGAGVALYAFRDQIGEVFQAIGDTIKNVFTTAFNIYKSIFIDPMLNLGQSLIGAFTGVFQQIGQAIKAPFQAVMGFVKNMINNMLQGIASAINGVVDSINRIIKAANRALAQLRLPQIPLLPRAEIPRFAEGGVVNGPTLAMVGEGAEPEYIIPASKMGKASAAYLSGVRGPAVIPRFAEGGFVAPANASVNIQTGPVTQMNGQNFVTTQDMTAAVRAGVQQTLDILRRDGTVRSQLGLT